jgi:general secretion pathway protein E
MDGSARAPSVSELRSRLAEHLVSTGKLRSSDADRMLELADEDGQSLGLLLARVGLLADRDVAHAYSELLSKPLLGDDEVVSIALADVAHKESFLRESKILPLTNDAEQLRVATADPENEFALDALTLAVGKPLAISIATVTQIERGLDLCFGGAPGDSDDPAAGEGEPSTDAAETIERLRDLASEAPIIRLVNLIIQRAVEARASDIHVEPRGDDLQVRYRIDGVLQETSPPPARSAAAIVSRIKLMAKMNIAERRLPQDGRIHLRIQGTLIDLRVSTVPTVDGESVVLRILAQDRVALDLETLGFDERDRATLQTLIDVPHGIILVTGPTGSGKTTTLYALLRRLDAAENKILTIEDPVEYQLEGINQIQVKPQIGLDFPLALRAIVRQDPDIIMIGEMRDLETARIAVQSALTGHLVLSTLHTNDAGSSVIRLLDMGVEDYLVTSSVNAIVAQRLVRRLCVECRKPYEAPPALVEQLSLRRFVPEGPLMLAAAGGCAACERTGYHGRTVIAEVLVLSDSVRRAVLERADGKTLERIATHEGMRTMKDDGLRKALHGVTTIEEVTRVTNG